MKKYYYDTINGLNADKFTHEKPKKSEPGCSWHQGANSWRYRYRQNCKYKCQFTAESIGEVSKK